MLAEPATPLAPSDLTSVVACNSAAHATAGQASVVARRLLRG